VHVPFHFRPPRRGSLDDRNMGDHALEIRGSEDFALTAFLYLILGGFLFFWVNIGTVCFVIIIKSFGKHICRQTVRPIRERDHHE